MRIKPPMSRLISKILLGCFILVGLISCADLKQINAFAVASHQALEKNKNISYGFVKYAEDSSYIYHPYPDGLGEVDCSCSQQQKLDSINKTEYQALSKYFEALAKFTDPKYSFDLTPVNDAVPSGTYAGITITDEESSIVTTLTGFLSGVITSGYKSRKLQDYIKLYQDSVAPLIAFMKIRSEALGKKIKVMEHQLWNEANGLLRSEHDDKMKWPVLFTYELHKKELDREIEIYSDAVYHLNKVTEGGNLIYQNMEHLKSEEFKKKLNAIIRNLIYNGDSKD
jgi:hypothetical protein